MFRKIFKWIGVAAGAAALAVTVVIATYQSRQIKRQDKQIAFQQEVIDSLLNRRMTVFDVSLAVTDKSRVAVYGRYNKGAITVPAEKTYVLEIDSSRVEVKPN